MQLTPRVRHVAAVDRSVGHEGEGRVEEWRRLWILEEERPCAASGEDSLASESCVTEEKNHSINQSVCVRSLILAIVVRDGYTVCTPAGKLLLLTCMMTWFYSIFSRPGVWLSPVSQYD